MRLRLLVLTAAALLSLVPGLALADDDSGDNDRAPVSLTTPAHASTAAAPTTVTPTAPSATADVDDDHADRDNDHADRPDRDGGGDRADQVKDRAAWCHSHAEACATALAAHKNEIVAWCKAHADKCPFDELKKVLERIATTPIPTGEHRP